MNKQTKHIGYSQALGFKRAKIKNTPQGNVVEYVPAEQPRKAKQSTSILNFAARGVTMLFLTLLVMGTLVTAVQGDPQEAYEKAQAEKAEAEYQLAKHKLKEVKKKSLDDATEEDFFEMKRLEEKVEAFMQGRR